MDATIKPTPQQEAFLSALLEKPRKNIALVARAGTGKTSTILLGVNALVRDNPDAEIVVCAFNKAIADEVSEKLKRAGHNDWRRVSACTIHSLGYSLLKFLFKPKIDDNKIRDLVDARMDTISQSYRAQIIQLVKLAKQAGVGFFNDVPIGDVGAWHQLADHFDVNGLEDTSDMDAIVSAAQEVYRASLAMTNVIDFDDMILFPLIKNLRVRFGKDEIFLDEAQDLSRARQALAKKFLKPDGRMTIVGDDRQAIYGFSGADAAALDNLTASLSATRLPLSITWRCPKAVVTEAQKFVADIEAAPSAIEGDVIHQTELPENLIKGDAILCRKTAPLISAAYKLIRAGKPVKVEGRAIGEGLLKLALRWKLRTIDALLTRLDDYKAREVQKALARGSEAKAEEISDRVETLVQICQACVEKGKTDLDDIKEFINNLFTDGATNCIVLATYHRSKGREWGRVILLGHSIHHPSKAAKLPWQRAQEDNLAYVAITRAQNTLVYAG